MSTFVAVNTYTHSVTYVTENILRSLQDIVRLSGLDPGQISEEWETLERGIAAWIDSQDLETVVLEVYNPEDSELIGRWDIQISYGWNGNNGRFWVDTDQIKIAIRKAGVWPNHARYRIVCCTKTSAVHVVGWFPTTLRSISGMIKQNLGTTVDHNGLAAAASYYRKRG